MADRPVRLWAPMAAAVAVSLVALLAVVVTGDAGRDEDPAAQDLPVVETALPTPEPSEQGCADSRTGSPAPQLPARTASVTRLAADGTLTWTRALPVGDAFPGHFPPLVLGERTLVLAGGTLRAYATATGRELWVVPAEGSPYGLWESGGTVVVLVDQVSQQGRVLGFDPQDGALRWTYPLPGNGLMADQVLADDGSLVMVLSGGNRLQVLDTATGEVRWTAERGGSPFAAVSGDVVLQTAGGRLDAYRLVDGSPLWSTAGLDDELRAVVVAGVVVTTPTVQGPGFDTGLRAYDPETGALLWSRSGGQQPLRVAGELPGAVLVADDDVAAPALSAIDARTGEVRWSVQARTAYEQPLVVGAGVLAVIERRGESTVVARRDQATGALLDEAPLPHELALHRLDGDRYLFQTYGREGEPGTVTVRSLETGEQRYVASVRHAAQAPASLPDGGIVVQGADPGRACAW